MKQQKFYQEAKLSFSFRTLMLFINKIVNISLINLPVLFLNSYFIQKIPIDCHLVSYSDNIIMIPTILVLVMFSKSNSLQQVILS